MNIKRLVAEFIGTTILVTTAAGSFLIHAGTGGQLGIVGIGLITGLTLMILIYTLGHISGAHFNPAVTIAFATVRKFPQNLIIPYIAAQILGGIAGVGILKVLLSEVAAGQSIGMLEMGIRPVNGFGTEVFIACILMLVIMGVATDRRAADPAAAGLPIGLAVVMLTMFAAPLTGAALNPARAFGPAVWAQDWSLQWIYWIAPIVGATLGAVIYEFIRTTEAPKSGDYGLLGPIK